jgi:hypothetical protein
LYVPCMLCDQMKKDEVQGSHRILVREVKCIWNFSRKKPKGRICFRYLSVNVRTVLKILTVSRKRTI